MMQDARDKVRYDWIKRLQAKDPGSDVLQKEAAIIEEQKSDLIQEAVAPAGLAAGGSAMVRGYLPDTSELLSKPADDWVEDFNNLTWSNPSVMTPPLPTLQSAALQDPAWGITLAEAMMTPEPKDTPAWTYIIDGLSQADLTAEQQASLLDIMRSSTIQARCGDSIAEHLYTIVKHGGKPFAADIIDQAENVASSLWPHIECDTKPEENRSWFDHATSFYGVGYLPLFWANATGIRMRNQGRRGLTDACKESMTAMLNENTTKGFLAQSAIGTQTTFLLKADEQWTTENVLPLFSTYEDPRAVPSWEGFVRAQRVDAVTSEHLGLTMHQQLDAISRMLPAPEDQRNLARCYSAMLCYYAQDPGSWLKETVLSNERMATLTEEEIHNRLRQTNPVQQMDWWHRWIRNYWDDRQNGLPEPFSNDEALVMWSWAAEMPAVYPEVARMAAGTPFGRAEWTDLEPILEKLSELPAAREHPRETAELLSVLLPKAGPDYYQAARRMAEPLFHSILEDASGTSQDLRTQRLIYQLVTWMRGSSEPSQ